MSSSAPPGLEALERLLEAEDFDAARRWVTQLPPGEAATVARLRLALADGTLTPDAVMQGLTQLMRRSPEAPGAREVYQLASSSSFSGGRSSPAYSHRPPPVREDDGEQ